jgi:hypothetical protein
MLRVTWQIFIEKISRGFFIKHIQAFFPQTAPPRRGARFYRAQAGFFQNDICHSFYKAPSIFYRAQSDSFSAHCTVAAYIIIVLYV